MARQRIPGLEQATEIALQGVIDTLTKRIAALELSPPAPPLITRNFTAREGQYLRVAAVDAGITITLPRPRPTNRAARITLAFETTNTVTIRAVDGLVNGEEYVTCAVLGTFDCVSNGASSWSVGLGVSSRGVTPGLRGPAGGAGAQGQPGADGNDGIDGEVGPAGFPGATGATGAPGLNGADGESGPEGAPGIAGADGAAGATGAAGDTGDTGPTGDAGADGVDGVDGIDGAPGAAGATGATGDAGPTGDPGLDGIDGAPGGVGATGATGPTGLQGLPGSDGADGADGVDGDAGAAGATGATGDTGATGAVGATGATGATGIQGPAANDGIDGAEGLQGAQGVTGATGPQGIPGMNGNDGIDGLPGEPAAMGPLTLAMVPDGLITNAKHFPMGAGTVLLRALGAGTGPPVEGTGSEVAAIAAPSLAALLAGSGLYASGGLLAARPFIADYVANADLASSMLYARNATIDANGIASVPDLLNNNPATQSANANKPQIGISANGLPIIIANSSDSLVWPLIAANNNNSTTGFAFWFRPSTIAAGNENVVYVRPAAASADHFSFSRSGSLLRLAAFFGSGSFKSADTAAATLVAGAWHFVTAEYNSTLATDATRMVVTVGAAIQTLTVTTIGAGGPTLQTATGNAPLMIAFPGHAAGPCIFARVSAMAGVTEGVWTPAGRASLMAIEAPT